MEGGAENTSEGNKMEEEVASAGGAREPPAEPERNTGSESKARSLPEEIRRGDTNRQDEKRRKLCGRVGAADGGLGPGPP